MLEDPTEKHLPFSNGIAGIALCSKLRSTPYLICLVAIMRWPEAISLYGTSLRVAALSGHPVIAGQLPMRMMERQN